MSTLITHLPQLISAIFIFILGFIVISKSGQLSTHIGFSVLAFSSSLWLSFYYLAYVLSDYSAFLYKLGFSFVIFTGVGAYHFATSYVNLNKEAITTKFSYWIGVVFLCVLWSTDYLLTNERFIYSWGYYPKAGGFHPALLMFFIGMMTRLNYLLFLKFINSGSDSIERARTRSVFISAIFFTLAASDFIPNYGVGIYPIGFIFAGIYSSIMAYSILRYQLLDIEIIIRRAAVFAGLFTFSYGVFATFTVIGQSYFENYLGWNRWFSMLPTVLVITFALRPIENFLTDATEKYLFQKKYDYRQLLRTFTSEVLTVLNLQQLLDKTIEGLARIIKLESCGVFLQDTNSKYELRAGIGIKEPFPLFSAGEPLPYKLNASREALQKNSVDGKTATGVILSREFKRINAEVCVPLIVQDKMVGFLSLGMKKSGENYIQEDIDILMSLARTEAIAISNAQLFSELSKTQAEAAQSEKMAVIGTLAAGINHEICNPLGIARGQCEMFLLNYKDGLYKDVPEKELLEKCTVIFNKAINEIDRATGITKRLSSFAKPSSKFAFSEVSANEEIKEILAILNHELRLDNIEVINNIPESLAKMFVDKKQIQEVFFNIIRNAAQAISGKGSIALSGYEKGDRVVVEIQDTGCGIPADKIKEIFNPFYTTKAPGKGTGLGLFIVKQVVERNKGTIAVESEEGKGTKFTLSFETAKQLAAA